MDSNVARKGLAELAAGIAEQVETYRFLCIESAKNLEPDREGHDPLTREVEAVIVNDLLDFTVMLKRLLRAHRALVCRDGELS